MPCTICFSKLYARIDTQRSESGDVGVVVSGGIDKHIARLLLGLEVVEQYRALLRLLTPILDDHTRAVDDFAGVAFSVDLAC